MFRSFMSFYISVYCLQSTRSLKDTRHLFTLPGTSKNFTRDRNREQITVLNRAEETSGKLPVVSRDRITYLLPTTYRGSCQCVNN